MLNRLVVAIGLGAVPAIAAAQSPRDGLSFLSLDGVVGYVNHTTRSGSTYYETEKFGWARIGIAVRLGSRAALRPVATIDYAGAFGRGDDLAICRFAPNGTCLARYPSASGVALGAGIRAAVGPIVVFGVTGGIGRYKRSYAQPSESSTGFHADAEVALRFMKHAGVVLNLRHVELEKFQGARMWYQPVTFGLRIQ